MYLHIQRLTTLFHLFFIQGGSRPHVIFAKNEVRVRVFDDGGDGKALPTGFSADVEGAYCCVKYAVVLSARVRLPIERSKSI